MKFVKCFLIAILFFGIFSCSKETEKPKYVEWRQLTKEQAEEIDKKELKSLLDHKDEFIKGLKNPDSRKRCESMAAIRDLNLKEAIPHVIDVALNDSDEKVFKSAVSALAVIGDERAIPVMLKGIESNDIWVRRVAADKLAELRRKEGIKGLIELLDSGNDFEVKNALSSLKRFTKKDFGTYSHLQNIPGQPASVTDLEKLKEVIARWKQWWKEEGDKFEFPK